MLQGKKILLGITGSIAAYKSAFLVRLLKKEGAEVRVILTESAKDFVTPVTLATLSENPVVSDYYKSKEEGTWENHVELGLWADLMLIAPATANTLAKMVEGSSDNVLLTTYLSARCEVVFSPAMDLDMYKHETTQSNIKTLVERGNILIEPTHGELASGLIGQGRMEEPETIVQALENIIAEKLDFNGKRVLVTAGPTYENIDPVRFIGNYSSGKMGFALAGELAQRGAQVTLVAGPVSLPTPAKSIRRIDVTSAEDMFEAATAEFVNCDAAILSAAVADYRPSTKADQKIKKADQSLTIHLEPTRDILATLGEHKTENQTLVGFALETNNEVDNARVKLKKKNLDFIVLNSLNDKGAGFAHDTNKISILSANNKVDFELKSKLEVAADIVDYLKTCMR